LTLFHQMRCRLAEGYEAFAFAADHFDGHDDELYAWLLLSKSWFSMFSASADAHTMQRVGQEALAILQRYPARGVCAMTISGIWRASFDAYKTLIAENLAAYRAKDDSWGVAWLLHRQGAILHYQTEGQTQQAKALYEESLTNSARIGDAWGATWVQAHMGLLAEAEGRYHDAYDLYMTRLKTCEAVGDAGGVAYSLQEIAKVSLELDDINTARYYCRESLRVALDISSGHSVHEAILRIASMYLRLGRQERAMELSAVVLDHLERVNYTRNWVVAQVEKFKRELPPEMVARALHRAQQWSLRELGWALLDELADVPASPILQQNLTETLSERELEVLRLVAEGLSNREIAARLVVTLGTVKKHLNNIFGKLGVERRTQAIARAQELQLIL